jgi:hypothetical protein
MGAGSNFSQGANTSTANPYAGSTSPYFQAANAQALGNLAGAQQATAANRVNQNTPYQSLNYTQTTDANGNPVWTANQSLNPMFQGTLSNLAQNAQQATQNSLGNGPQLQTSVGGTGTQGWDAATQMLMSRLQPQIAQQTEQQASNLANQGIVPGTKAYENAMRTFNQGQNDLLTSAQMQGANLQNQLFNQNVQAGQFGNTANQQMFANQLTAQNAPLQQLGAFQSATNPNYVNTPLQAAATGPDYMGALNTQTNQNIAAQNAALGQQTNNTAGLYGLGAAGILGLAANPGLVSSGLTRLSNLFSSPSSTSSILNSTGFTPTAGNSFTLG